MSDKITMDRLFPYLNPVFPIDADLFLEFVETKNNKNLLEIIIKKTGLSDEKSEFMASLFFDIVDYSYFYCKESVENGNNNKDIIKALNESKERKFELFEDAIYKIVYYYKDTLFKTYAIKVRTNKEFISDPFLILNMIYIDYVYNKKSFNELKKTLYIKIDILFLLLSFWMINTLIERLKKDSENILENDYFYVMLMSIKESFVVYHLEKRKNYNEQEMLREFRKNIIFEEKSKAGKGKADKSIPAKEYVKREYDKLIKINPKISNNRASIKIIETMDKDKDFKYPETLTSWGRLETFRKWIACIKRGENF
ncbi:MAG: hypothetical protein ACTSXL_03405 [Alphaproteobacteria bacterium]